MTHSSQLEKFFVSFDFWLLAASNLVVTGASGIRLDKGRGAWGGLLAGYPLGAKPLPLIQCEGVGMYRVLIAECKQEISSFNPVASHYDDFIITFGDAFAAQHQGVQSEVAGALGVFGARDDVEVIP